MRVLTCVWLLATPWTVAHQVPPSMGFSRQEYWNGVPLPSPKNTLEGINSRISEAEEQINELEDKMVEVNSEEQNKVKRMKRTEDSLRDLWDNTKCTNFQIIGVPEEEEKKERVWEKFWRDYSWKFPQHGKGNRQSNPIGTKNPIQDKPKITVPGKDLVQNWWKNKRAFQMSKS